MLGLRDPLLIELVGRNREERAEIRVWPLGEDILLCWWLVKGREDGGEMELR